MILQNVSRREFKKFTQVKKGNQLFFKSVGSWTLNAVFCREIKIEFLNNAFRFKNINSFNHSLYWKGL